MSRASVIIATLGLVAGCGSTAPTGPPKSFAAPSSISVSADRTTLLVGESALLRALVTHADGTVATTPPTTTWKSSDDAVCHVSPNGTVSALGVGRATITATWLSASATIELTAEPSVRGRVTDFLTGNGVPAVQVQLTGQSKDTRATTDANGAYVMPMLPLGRFSVAVDSRPVGSARLTGIQFRGDLVIDRGPCIARYGTIADARTLAPVAGATVRLAGITTTSGPDGWYRIDLGCPSSATIGFNTTFLYVTHPNYTSGSMIVGRGIQQVIRLDVDLEPG